MLEGINQNNSVPVFLTSSYFYINITLFVRDGMTRYAGAVMVR